MFFIPVFLLFFLLCLACLLHFIGIKNHYKVNNNNIKINKKGGIKKMEKIFIEYVCLSLELVDDNFSWDSLDNINDDEVEAF